MFIADHVLTRDMQIMVCGSIGYDGVEEIRHLYTLLSKAGFGTIDHLKSEEMDYSDIKDFRYRKDLSRQIIKHDLEYIKKADVLVVLAGKPSYGTGIEMFIARSSGKHVILYAPEPVPTPWPVNFCNEVVTREQELIRSLSQLE